MALGGNPVLLIEDQTTLGNASGSGTECSDSTTSLASSLDDCQDVGTFRGDVQKTINMFSHCEVKMKTEYSASSSNDKLKAQADILVQRWRKKYDGIMVDTRAYQHAKKMLEESHSVLISGGPGDGKTTLAVHLTLSLVSDGYLPVVAYSPADIQRCCNPYERMVFLLDDVFGKSYLVREYLKEWVQRGHMISQLMSENTKFIFTNRNENLRECLTDVHEIAAFDNLVDLVDLKTSAMSLNSNKKKAMFNSLIAKYKGSHDNDNPLDVIDTFCSKSHNINLYDDQDNNIWDNQEEDLNDDNNIWDNLEEDLNDDNNLWDNQEEDLYDVQNYFSFEFE